MTEKEIIAGNKIIVEFDTNAKKITAVMSEKLPYDLWEHKQQFSPVGINQLRYHISWDWLMPVVEQIEAKGYNVVIYTYSCRISDTETEMEQFYGESDDSKIEAIWLAVVEFIKWYNTQKL